MSANFERWGSVEPLRAYLADAFDVEERFDGHAVWERSNGSLWIARRELTPPDEGELQAIGLLVSRRPLRHHALSTPFVRRFLTGARRRVVDIDGEGVEAYMRGESQPWRDRWPDGQRVVRAAGVVLGRGRLRDGLLLSELPKAYRLA